MNNYFDAFPIEYNIDIMNKANECYENEIASVNLET